ncbi:MAG TPA: GNAT family N-acetyltransferase [Erysipelotrichaceae bacterium]|nr:GNAT family N-acetyltransferase [Erysipelotrichaceae bacterium]
MHFIEILVILKVTKESRWRMELKHDKGIFYFGDSIETYVVKMETTLTEPVLTITHTEVSENHKGQGWGRKLLDALETFAAENGWNITATCTYAKGQLEKEKLAAIK